MPARLSFEYAVVRVVPRVDREEFINAGVIVFCLEKRFLRARVAVDKRRILALWPHADLEVIRQHLEAIPLICEGNQGAGPIGALSVRERFHWLVSPRSTVIQVSAAHSGLCDSPEQALDRLYVSFVDHPSTDTFNPSSPSQNC